MKCGKGRKRGEGGNAVKVGNVRKEKMRKGEHVERENFE
jgi:hypothetical protein